MSDPLTPPPVPEAAPVVLAEPVAPPSPPLREPELAANDTVPEPWRNLLMPGEQVIWQGAPVAPERRSNLLSDFLAPAFFVAVGLGVAQSAGGGVGSLIGVGFAALAVWLTVRRRRGSPALRRETRYLLTTHRALIATRLGARAPQVQSWLLDARLHPRLAGNAVYFAQQSPDDEHGPSLAAPVGFVGLADAPAVYDLFRQTLTGQR